MSRTARWLTAAVAIFVATCLQLVLGGAPAWAHATLLSMTPGDSQVLDTSPREVSLTFSESVDLGLAEVRLLGPSGEQVDVGSPTHPNGRTDIISVAVPGVRAEGTYTVAWHAVSADSHPVQGAFTFSLVRPTGTAAPAQVANEPSSGVAGALYGVFGWVAFAGFTLLVGAAFFIAVCWPGGAGHTPARRLLWTGWAGLLVATIAALVLYGPYVTGQSLGGVVDPTLLASTLNTRMGTALGVRVLLLCLGIGGLAILLRQAWPTEPRASAIRGGAILAGAMTLGVTWGLASHSGSGMQVPIALPTDVVHLVAMGVWIGGLVMLGVFLRGADVQAMRVGVPRFSRTALACVGLLVVTGVYQSWRQVGTLPALISTSYGWLLVAKVVLVFVLLGLGAAARSWVHRHYAVAASSIAEKRRAKRGPESGEVNRFRRLVLVEAVIGTLVLGLTAFLVNTEPARAEQARATRVSTLPTAAGPVSVTLRYDTGGGQPGRGSVALVVTPARVGRNAIHLQVLDAAGRPRDVPELRIQFSLPERSVGPIPVPLAYGGLGHYVRDNVTLPMPGRWQLAVTVRTSEVDQTTVTTSVNVT